MRIALFGGTGFVGSYLVDALVSAAMHPVLLVRPSSEHKVEQARSCTVVSGDIADRHAIDRALAGASGVIYNIGILREFPQRGITYEALHFAGAQRVMDAAEAAGVKRLLLMSANGVKAEGTPYQRSKYLAEQHLATTGLDWTVFRPSVLFGDPRGRQEFATQLLSDIIDSPLPAPLFYAGVLPLHAGDFQLSPVHVEDVARAFVAALREPRTIGQILPLGGPRALTWREILAAIAAVVGKRKLMLPAPASAVAATAAMLERFPASPITGEQVRMLMEGNTCSAEAFTALGVSPRAFDARSLRYLAERRALGR
jgi:NADH dehydrogenase